MAWHCNPRPPTGSERLPRFLRYLGGSSVFSSTVRLAAVPSCNYTTWVKILSIETSPIQSAAASC